jgi:hypothetical protein
MSQLETCTTLVMIVCIFVLNARSYEELRMGPLMVHRLVKQFFKPSAAVVIVPQASET